MWRCAKPEDDRHIVEMCLELNHEDPGPHAVHASGIAKTLEIFRSKPRHGSALVLVIEKKVVGYAFLIPFWSNELGGDVCIVDELFVAPDYRGRRWATQLLQSLCVGSEFLPNGCVAIGLEVSPTNRKAKDFYRRLGFAGENTILMRRIDASSE